MQKRLSTSLVIKDIQTENMRYYNACGVLIKLQELLVKLNKDISEWGADITVPLGKRSAPSLR